MLNLLRSVYFCLSAPTQPSSCSPGWGRRNWKKVVYSGPVGCLGFVPGRQRYCFILHACPFKNVSMYSITWTVILGNSPLRVESHILFCLGTHLGSGSLCLDFTCTCVKGVFTVALLNCNPVTEVCSWYVCHVKDFYFIFYAV